MDVISPHAILQPVVALIAWTLVLPGWLLATRLPAMVRAGVKLSVEAQWKAHNHNHLPEQPVLFYAVSVVSALTGTGYGVNVALAWTYVGLRVAHSIWQSTANRVSVRFCLFIASSLVLAALTLHAGLAVF